MDTQTPPQDPNQVHQAHPERPEASGRYELRFPMVRPIITYGLLAILVLIHLYVMSLNRIDLINFYNDYANVASAVSAGEYYRLLTSMFLHADLMHLLFNCFFIYVFGKEIEGLFGSLRFALIYFLGGLTGSAASYIITQSSSIGASGAAFAIFGAAAAYFLKHRALYGESANRQLRQLGTLALINLAIGFVSNVPGSPVRIDNAAHIGGALGGLALAWFISPQFEMRMRLDGGRVTPTLVDVKNTRQWFFVPLLYAAVLLALVAYVISVRGA